MAVISLTITESSVQVVPGIPQTVTITANIPSTIFYTFDGTDPNSSSLVYLAPIVLPKTAPTVLLKILATNGTDTSSVIVNHYGFDQSTIRKSHASVTGLDNRQGAVFPFASNAQNTTFNYGNAGNAGITVDAPDVPNVTTNYFDANGNPVGATDLPLDQYKQIYTTTDALGQTGKGIGTIPSQIRIIPKEAAPQSSDRADKVFNPKALVIYQDSRTESGNDPTALNREFFALENPEFVRDGALLYNDGPDTLTSTGSFLKSYVNPRDNTITYYYYDNAVNRWIISKQPYQLKDPNVSNLSGMVFGRGGGAGMVYLWRPFMRRALI